MKHLKRQLTPANVLSCVALFVALSGAAYAATAALPKKSVKTRHLAKGVVTTQKLRNGAVTAAKLRNGAVIGAKIAPGAVGSSQLADGGVRSADLGGGVVTTQKLKNGAVTGEKIANGAVTNSKLGTDSVTAGKIQEGAVTASKLAPGFNSQLVKNVSFVTKTSGVIPISSETVTAECPAGKQAIGGGARVLGANTKVALNESAPAVGGAGKHVGWTATANEFAEEAADWTLEVHAICAEF
jgi:hypothetical protein